MDDLVDACSTQEWAKVEKLRESLVSLISLDMSILEIPASINSTVRRLDSEQRMLQQLNEYEEFRDFERSLALSQQPKDSIIDLN